jgi:hypothetical protein
MLQLTITVNSERATLNYTRPDLAKVVFHHAVDKALDTPSGPNGCAGDLFDSNGNPVVHWTLTET